MSRKRYDYRRLKRSLSLQMLWMIAVAAVAVLAARVSLTGWIGNFVVSLMERFLYLESGDALELYQRFFRDNIEILVAAAFLIFLFVLYRMSITRLTRYFDEIQDGLDQLVSRDGRDIHLSPKLAFMEDKLNQVKTELDRQSQAILLSEQRKNDLVVYLAHDIKTPLTSVIGYLNLLDESPELTAEQRAKYVGLTLEKAYRLDQLINEFFDITRFSLQSIVLNKEAINLPFMLRQLADEFYPMLTPLGKTAEVEAEDALTLYADPDKLARVFNNIMKNATAYSAENSRILIRAYRRDNEIVITFTNRGNTIPAARLESIFEKFYRLDDSRASNTGGAGLGLAIAREITQAHGGSIDAASSDGVTVFTVRLPAA